MDTECFPPGYEGNGRVPAPQVFSPGACPHGYVTQSPVLVDAGVTTASCCSIGFTFSTNDGGNEGCLSTFTGATSLAARAGGEIFSSTDTTSHTSISGTFQMWGQVLTVAFDNDQLSLYTTTTSSTPTSSSTAVTSTPTTAVSSTTSSASTNLSPTTTSSPSNHSSGGLSGGAKAGIAIAVVVGAFLLIGAAFVWWRRRRIYGRSGYTSELAAPLGGDLQYKYGEQPPLHAPVELLATQPEAVTRRQPRLVGGYGPSEMPS